MRDQLYDVRDSIQRQRETESKKETPTDIGQLIVTLRKKPHASRCRLSVHNT